MKSARDTNAKQKTSLLALSVLCASFGISAASPALAQESAGVEQDYLLPPEVVPMDSATANSMTASQALQRTQQASSAGAGSDGSVPGLVGDTPSYQSAQDFRKQMFNSLYNQAPAQWGNNNQVLPNQYGGQNPGQSLGQYPGQYPGANQMPSYQGQVPGLMPQAQQGQEVHPMMITSMPQTAQANAPQYQGQGQTLTGAPKSQPVRRDIRRRGFTNVLNSATSMGTGFILGAALGRGGINPLYSAGMYGLGMNGIGNRNAFRF